MENEKHKRSKFQMCSRCVMVPQTRHESVEKHEIMMKNWYAHAVVPSMRLDHREHRERSLLLLILIHLIAFLYMFHHHAAHYPIARVIYIKKKNSYSFVGPRQSWNCWNHSSVMESPDWVHQKSIFQFFVSCLIFIYHFLNWFPWKFAAAAAINWYDPEQL